MSINLKGQIDDYSKLKNTTGRNETAEVNYKNSYADEVAEKFFENRIRREWLTTKEAAQYLLISENALRIMAHRKQIPAYKFGRRLRFTLEDCRFLVFGKGAFNGN